MTDEHEPITKAEARQLIRKAADEAGDNASRRVLKGLGIDADNWQEHQKDQQYLRQMRIGSEQVRAWGWRAAIGVLVPTVIWVLWQGIKLFVKSKAGGGP